MRRLTLCLLALSSACPPLHAQTEVLPPVSTALQRDRDVIPYRQINTVLSKLARHGEGLVRMDFRVDAEKSRVPAAQVRLAVRSDEADYPVTMDAEGRFHLPVLPEAEAANADLATNAPKGQLSVRGTIEMNVKPEELDMAKVRQILRVGRTLREELLPFYLRWLFPRLEAVRICSDTPTWELEWRENGQLLGLPLPVAPGERDPEARKGDKPRPCALLTGQENWPDAARLVPPPGSRLSVKF